MKSFTVEKNDSNQRLDKFISKACPVLPQGLMYKYIRTKRIKVNGKRAEISTRLNIGDIVDCYINDEFFVSVAPKYDFLSSPAKLNIVYEDENIILVDKPQGIIVHPDEKEYRDTLIGRIQHYLYDKGEYDPKAENSFKPSLANRIDRNTGGIVIAAKNAEALRILCEKIKDREIDNLCNLILFDKSHNPFFFDDKENCKVQTPDDVAPVGTMPEARCHPYNKDIEEPAKLRNSVSAHGDVEVVSEPCAKRHVPSSPEFRYGFGDVGVVEVFHEFEAEDDSETDSHIAVA